LDYPGFSPIIGFAIDNYMVIIGDGHENAKWHKQLRLTLDFSDDDNHLL